MIWGVVVPNVLPLSKMIKRFVEPDWLNLLRDDHHCFGNKTIPKNNNSAWEKVE